MPTPHIHNIKTVCFDLFSTLVSVGNVPESVGGFTADILGVSHEQWYEACFGEHHEICRPTNAHENLRRMAYSLNPDITEQQILTAVEARQRRFDYALENIEAGVLQGLQRLESAGFRLALISNASTAEVSAWDKSPLAPFFHSVAFSCECGYQKPQAEIYQLTLKRLDVMAKECVFVGDGGSQEHHGAHRCGMKLVLTRQFLRQARLEKIRQQLHGLAYHEISHVKDLPGLLHKLQEEVPEGRSGAGVAAGAIKYPDR